MSENDALKEEVSELREAVMHLAATVHQTRFSFWNVPDGRIVQNNSRKTHGYLTSLCYWLRGTAENTQDILTATWAKKLEQRSGQSIQAIAARFADGHSGNAKEQGEG